MPASPEEHDHMATDTSGDGGISVLRRLRSTTLLVALVVALGALSAAIIGVLIVSLVSLLDHALG